MISVGFLAEVAGGSKNTTPFQHDIPFDERRTNRTDNPDARRYATAVCSGFQRGLG